MSASNGSNSSDTVTLISEEGDSFTIERRVALQIGTIKSMLEGGFEEGETNVVNLQIRTPILEKVIEYLEWKDKYSDAPEGTKIPDFEKSIPPELCLELLMTADFLDT